MTPLRIENHARSGVLTVEWPDGSRDDFPHAVLRAACPCAACRAVRRAGGTVAADDGIRLTAIVPAGANALTLAFSDGHARGIYPFALLADLRVIQC